MSEDYGILDQPIDGYSPGCVATWDEVERVVEQPEEQGVPVDWTQFTNSAMFETLLSTVSAEDLHALRVDLDTLVPPKAI